jgi:1,6-anhydro-N-acetylmuramate kinase
MRIIPISRRIIPISGRVVYQVGLEIQSGTGRGDSRDRAHERHSLDGIDAALVDTDGETVMRFGPSASYFVPHLPQPPSSVIVAGGGADNRTVMAMLAERLAPASVETATAAGCSADAIEAQAFAYLAVRSLLGLPITFPGATARPAR